MRPARKNHTKKTSNELAQKVSAFLLLGLLGYLTLKMNPNYKPPSQEPKATSILQSAIIGALGGQQAVVSSSIAAGQSNNHILFRSSAARAIVGYSLFAICLAGTCYALHHYMNKAPLAQEKPLSSQERHDKIKLNVIAVGFGVLTLGLSLYHGVKAYTNNTAALTPLTLLSTPQTITLSISGAVLSAIFMYTSGSVIKNTLAASN